MQTAMEIRHGNKKACLYEPPLYKEWFDNHGYDWRHKHRSFRENPSTKLKEIYNKAITRHLRWQGTLIKTFMKNCNGDR